MSASVVLYILLRRLNKVRVRLAKAVQRCKADAETSGVSVRGRRRVLKVVYPLLHRTSVGKAGQQVQVLLLWCSSQMNAQRESRRRV